MVVLKILRFFLFFFVMIVCELDWNLLLFKLEFLLIDYVCVNLLESCIYKVLNVCVCN